MIKGQNKATNNRIQVDGGSGCGCGGFGNLSDKKLRIQP